MSVHHGDGRALLWIDLQTNVCQRLDDGGEAVLENCYLATERALSLGIPVISVRVLGLRGRRRAASHYQGIGSDPERGTEVLNPPELVPQMQRFSDAMVHVLKPRRGAFTGTNLDMVLHDLEVTTLLIGGVATHLGVESTCRVGFDLGYAQTVLSDCCASFDLADHELAIQRTLPHVADISQWSRALPAGDDALLALTQEGHGDA